LKGLFEDHAMLGLSRTPNAGSPLLQRLDKPVIKAAD
jgi:hypothetical protein